MADDVRSAFERLFRAHYQAVLSYALPRAEPQLAKDATAATFLVAWRRYREIPAAPRPPPVRSSDPKERGAFVDLA